jgi:phosphoribosyl-ATP pyrophosphohydrolase
MADFTLEDLAAVVAARAQSGDPSSYTAKLIGRGVAKCAQKVGEEAVETALAAVGGTEAELRGEAADLIYHLLVLLQARGVPLADVMAELAGRTGQTGLEEKASRPAG